MRQIQQGDVIFKTATIPYGLQRVLDPIVQHGEHTGHSHRLQMLKHEGSRTYTTGDAPEIPCSQWEMFKDKQTGTRYLKVLEPTDLTHEEHNTIILPPGEYEIGIVQEYDHFAEEARQVQD